MFVVSKGSQALPEQAIFASIQSAELNRSMVICSRHGGIIKLKPLVSSIARITALSTLLNLRQPCKFRHPVYDQGRSVSLIYEFQKFTDIEGASGKIVVTNCISASQSYL